MSASAINNAVKLRWTATWTHTLTAYDNEPYTPAANTPWVRLAVRDGNSKQISLGVPSLDRHAGIVFVQVFSPLGTGDSRARWLADKACGVFRKRDLDTTTGSMTFGVPYTVAAETPGDNWFQINVLCPFTADELT